MCGLCYNGLSYNQKQEWAKTDSPITDCPITKWPITDCPIMDWAIMDWAITDWAITDCAIVRQGFLFGFRASGGRREPFEVWPGRFSTSNQSTARSSMATIAMSFLLSRQSSTQWDGVRTPNELTNTANSYRKLGVLRDRGRGWRSKAKNLEDINCFLATCPLLKNLA